MLDDTAQTSGGGASRSEPLDLAGIWTRATSASIDLALIGYGMIVSLAVLHSLGVFGGSETGPVIADTRGLVIFGAAWLLMAMVGLATCWCTLGASPGGMLLGCRVVDAQSRTRIGWGTASLRVLGLIAALLPLGLGWLAAAWDPRRRGWHDRIAGTLVVVEDESRASLDEWLKHCS